MSDASKHRLRLWLRSEQAFGLTSVASGGSPLAPNQVDALIHEVEPRGIEPDAESVVPAAQVVSNLRALTGATGSDAGATVPPLAGDAAPGLMMPSPTMPPFEAPLLAPAEKCARLVAMDDKEVRGCTKCRLCETRTKTVFGEGDSDARIFFIGEGPGENEDLTGRPFVGRAGDLLNKMIVAMGLSRERVFIANIVKCRPPGNREPAADEVATCTPYLLRQLEIVRPRAIVTLGRPSSQYMLQSKLSMSRLRGQWHDWRGIKLMPTYHPAYVLRNYTDQTRAAVWSDLQQVMVEIGLPVKKNRGGE